MPYQYSVYNVQDQARSAATNAKIAAMEAEGWRPHTVSCNFAELCIFWEKPLGQPAEDGDGGKNAKHSSSTGPSDKAGRSPGA